MKNKEFERKNKEDMPVIAICYDFDRTLSPDDMQAQGFIQSVGYNVVDFWRESNDLATDNDMDQNLSYMLKMFIESEGHFVLNKKALNDYGANIRLFPGVETWFERIREYGKQNGVIIEHYIISSGLKEMIEGTSVAKSGAFEKIYASSFYYNKRGVAVWPAQVVNFTNKTQYLFRIEKGVLDINDPAVNDHFEPEDLRVPFRNMIYIGDGLTDIPCMQLLKDKGGKSIALYQPQYKDKVIPLVEDNRLSYVCNADYTANSTLDSIVKLMIDNMVLVEQLKNKEEKKLQSFLKADENK